MKKLSLNALLPYILCIVLFYAVTIIYFKPEFFDGKSLFQSDIVQYEGASKEANDFNKTHEEKTLWTGTMFGGMPIYLIHADYPDLALAMIDWTFKGIFFRDKNAHQLLLTLITTFFALACFGVRPWIAAIGAVAFGLSTYNLIIIEVGHMTKSWAIAYAPLVLAGMYLAFQKEKIWQGFALFTLALALELRANHLQITYYLAFIAVFYGVSELVFAFKNKTLPDFAKATALLIVGASLAVGTSAGRILTTLEYGKYSQRGPAELTPLDAEAQGTGDGLDRDYAYNWSQGKFETLTLLIPNLYGGSSNEKLSKKFETYQILQNAVQQGQLSPEEFKQYIERAPFMYWGDQPFTGAPVYAGAVVCFLFILGLLLIEDRYRYWLLAGVVMMMMISWGRNLEWFNYTMFDYFPGFNKFRSVSMALSLAVMLMVIVGILGLKNLIEVGQNQQDFNMIFKKILIAFGATGGLALLLWLVAGSLDMSSPTDEQLGGLRDAVLEDRAMMLRNDALRTFFFITLSVVAIYFFLKKKISLQITTLIIGLLITVDLWTVGKRYLSESDFSKSRRTSVHQPTPADEKILKDKDLSYRVLNLNNPFSDAQTSYFHKSLGGYIAAKLRRYQDLIERQLSKEMQMMIGDLQKGRPQFANYRIINMLNTRYIKANESENGVLRNPNAYGNAWFVSNILEVKNADEEMKALDTLRPDSVAVIDISKFQVSKKQFATVGEIKMTAYQPNRLEYEYTADNESFAVFSEIYYPEGWTATIDGQPAKFVRVNYILRGMEVPQGKHKIAFTFHSKAYETGSTITMISCVLVLLLSVGALGFTFWKGK
ncbi:YfhO family protein [Thermoflexibacter ruber]|uniref:Membrane protein YfhO n=1 Tax=Thermoflexibacter ruber TaxID=1003 RepID=A0A1I2FBL0_9BACT|nr:YfhO family protein [Thermoflexibacter ruber]SFF02128.1 membrane protein YfhO [Thermoflexibacter ruber]